MGQMADEDNVRQAEDPKAVCSPASALDSTKRLFGDPQPWEADAYNLRDFKPNPDTPLMLGL